MQKSDLRELRKELKKAGTQDGILDWVYSFYVSAENELAWESVRFMTEMDEDEKFRHLAIVGKVLPSSIGKDLLPVQTEQNEALLLFREAYAGDRDKMKEKMSTLRDVLLTQYTHTDPYYAALFRFIYNVPARATDGARLEDGDSVYESLIFAVCPAKLSAPALGYNNEEVTNLHRRWTIGAPAVGFIYPSFNDRSEDRNETALYIKKGVSDEILRAIFDLKENAENAEDKKAAWNEVLTETGITSEEAALINESLCKSEEAYLDLNQLKSIAEEAGIDKDKFEKSYTDIIGDKEMPVAAISSDKVEIETDTAKIHVHADKAPFIKTKKIDGVEYILIPADGVLSVNGTAVVY